VRRQRPDRYVGAGSSTVVGDGLSMFDTAQEIHDMWAAMGSTTKKLLMMHGRNDCFLYGTGLSTDPATFGANIQQLFAFLDASDPGWTGIQARIPQGTSWGNNGGGFSLANYWTQQVAASTANGRKNVLSFDTTVFTAAGLALGTPAQWVEADPGQVHLAQPGADIVFGVARTWYGV